MELRESFLLEEFLALRRDNCSTYPTGAVMNQFFTDGWSFDLIDENQALAMSSMDPAMPNGFNSMPQMESFFDAPFSEVYNTLDASSFTTPVTTTVADQQFSLPFEISNSTLPLLPIHDQYTSIEEFSFLGNEVQQMEEDNYTFICKAENIQSPNENQGSKSSNGGKERRNGVKKVGGQPSKNLMAERRRRKRLNDRLSMLRSIVPRISKMDRTSILADTIAYMKELLDKVRQLEEEEEQTEQAGALTKLKELQSGEGHVKNSPKFNVKTSEKDIRINICCTPRPGLLLSTVNTLEALGLEIQQCVISCFNDFSMQAACSQVSEEQMAVTTKDIKHALFKNAGYEGKCL